MLIFCVFVISTFKNMYKIKCTHLHTFLNGWTCSFLGNYSHSIGSSVLSLCSIFLSCQSSNQKPALPAELWPPQQVCVTTFECPEIKDDIITDEGLHYWTS